MKTAKHGIHSWEPILVPQHQGGDNTYPEGYKPIMWCNECSTSRMPSRTEFFAVAWKEDARQIPTAEESDCDDPVGRRAR